MQEISKIEARGEYVCLIGDFNRKIGDLVPRNNSESESYGGSLIRQLIETGRYILVNASDKVKGGPFTRYDPGDPNNNSKKSVLDLVIVSSELENYVESLEIDKDMYFTPSRPISKGLRHSDHYALLFVLRNLPANQRTQCVAKSVVRWNTNKPGGWERYFVLANESKKLIDVSQETSMEPEKLTRMFDKELESIKYKSFGRCKEKSFKTKKSPIDEIQAEKNELFKDKDVDNEKVFLVKMKDVDSRLSKALLAKQTEALSSELSNMKSLQSKKGFASAIFQLKDDILGSKKMAQEASSLIDFKTGCLLTNPSDIKRVSLQYCQELLTNRNPKDGFEVDIEIKYQIHEARMMEKVDDDLDSITEQMFEETFQALKKKPGNKYEFIMNGGPAIKSALMSVCQSVWRYEKLPESWTETTLVQLYKGKGPKNNLENMRHIHIKNEFSKFFGHIVVSAMKSEINKNLSKFQIATKPGHRPQEHLFVLKSVIALYQFQGKALILQTYDFSKFFDRESLRDCMNELYKYNIKGKLYKLVYAMNERTKFKVKTPIGVSDEAVRGEGLAQGSLEGALVSSVNLDSGVRDYFQKSRNEVHYSSLQLGPLLFQDDISRLA